MDDETLQPGGPDLTLGVPVDTIPTEGFLAGHVGNEPVLVVRLTDGFFAIGGKCTHYGAPLADGLVTGDVIRCPWHHACFDLRSGEAVAAPAFDPLTRWKVDIREGRVFVVTPAKQHRIMSQAKPGPARVVIVGGGAAGFAAAEMLRRRGHKGSITMLSSDQTSPCDRTVLSKDYLSGDAPDEWLPLKPPRFYVSNTIELQLGTTVAKIDREHRSVHTVDGRVFSYDALLLATGATPVAPQVSGFDQAPIRTLRSEEDAKRLFQDTRSSRRVAVVGTGFIGLEVAAALRRRHIDVHVIGRDTLPLRNVLGSEIARLVKATHEKQGVIFHMGTEPTGFDRGALTLSDGTRIAVDLVVVGVGVAPRSELAERAGLIVDDGIVVDTEMRTSDPTVWAAGDVARYPGGRGGATIRVEHWVVAERQGQIAALSMLGVSKKLGAPFFWSRHFDMTISYVGHAAHWKHIEIDGDVESADATVRYYGDEGLLAVATVGREMDSLEAQRQLDG